MSNDIEFLTKPDAPSNLTPIANAYKLKPYVLDIADVQRFKESGIDYEDDFVVAVSKLKAIHFSEFESMFGMTLNNALLAGIHAQLALGVWQPEAVEALRKEGGVWYDPDKNEYHTPYGTLTKHPNTFYLDIIAFCLSQWGRVVEEGNMRDLEEITILDVLDHLDADLLSMTTEEGEMVFHGLMDKLGIDLFAKLDEIPIEDEASEGEQPPVEELTPTPKKRKSRAKKSDDSKTSEN